MILKNGLTHRIMMKEEEKYRYLYKKKKIIALVRDERGGKITTKLATTTPKTYSYKR